MTSHPQAGARENLISANVSNETFRALAEKALEAGTMIGAAAVWTGAIDGLARYACASQVTDATPEEITALFTAAFARLIAFHHQAPQGEA